MEWWKRAVVYQIYPMSFKDSNSDGMGDLGGILEKVDYLKELGVDIIWLTPVYESPMDDNGYDISDYYKINPLFGTMDQFGHLLDALHERGMKLIIQKRKRENVRHGIAWNAGDTVYISGRRAGNDKCEIPSGEI